MQTDKMSFSEFRENIENIGEQKETLNEDDYKKIFMDFIKVFRLAYEEKGLPYVKDDMSSLFQDSAKKTEGELSDFFKDVASAIEYM